MKYIKVNKINVYCLLKTSEQHMSKAFAEKIEKYLYYGQNVNRCYVKCPYCNGNGSLKKLHCYTKEDTIEDLIIKVKDRTIRLGNNVLVIPQKKSKKVYLISDMYYHFLKEHTFMPRKWFEQLVINGMAPDEDNYNDIVKKCMSNLH